MTISRDPCTVLMVTHNLNEAFDVSDRVLVMGGHPGVIKDDVRIDAPRGADESSTFGFLAATEGSETG